MSTSYYSSNSYYDQEQKRKAEERKNAPKTCPHCGDAINQHLSTWDRVHYHCGSDKCRKAASRHNIAERKRQERSAARARVLQYCDTSLDREQKNAVMEMTDLLMTFDNSGGHQIAQQVVQVIEVKRCKHDRIAELEANAALWQRRAQASERQLKERIAELEQELELFNSLHNSIHGIATQQLQKQPDPQEQPSAPEPPEAEQPDEDRARVLATLAHIGIKPIEQALAEQDEDSESYEGEEDDNPESYEDDEEPEE